MDSITIRPGDQSHLEVCKNALLCSEMGRVYFISDDRAIAYLTDGFTAGEIMVAVDEAGRALGFIRIKPSGAFGSFPYVACLAVSEAHRGKGIGSRLLASFEAEGFATASRVFLLVSDFNEAAQRLYRSRGYQQVGLLPGLFLDGIDELIMMKRRS